MSVSENCRTAPLDQSRNKQLVVCCKDKPSTVGALADIADKPYVVPGVGRQANHMSVFLLPSQAFEICKVIPMIRGSIKEGIWLHVRSGACDAHRWAKLGTAVASSDWEIG